MRPMRQGDLVHWHGLCVLGGPLPGFLGCLLGKPGHVADGGGHVHLGGGLVELLLRSDLDCVPDQAVGAGALPGHVSPGTGLVHLGGRL